MEFRIGAGGWQYFPLPSPDRLTSYSKLFNFVEVNSTFYNRIPFSTVRRWREGVPCDFEFSIKCPKEMGDALRDGERERLDSLTDYVCRVAEILEAQVIVLETPRTTDVNAIRSDLPIRMLERLRPSGLALAWEARSSACGEVPGPLRLRGVLPVADLCRDDPEPREGLLYSRLFGVGEHTLYRFTNYDLALIRDRGTGPGLRKAYFAFHGVAMYADSMRFKETLLGKRASA